MANSFGVLLFCFLACVPPPASAGEPEECAEQAAATTEDDCSSSACRMSLLQSRHEVTSQQRSEGTAGGAGVLPRKPNIVLFLPDDMYIQEYSPWNPADFAPALPDRIPLTNTPIHNAGVMRNLERIAQSGATFARAYSASSSCTPSRYSIMTGRHPSNSMYAIWKQSKYFPGVSQRFVSQHSMLGRGFKDQKSTIAVALRSLGYTTGMMGKWHLSPSEEADFGSAYPDQQDQVQMSGFDFVDGLYISNMCECSADVCDTFSHNLEWMLDRALYFMDDAMSKDLSFFLYFSPTPPHLPSVEDPLLGHFTPYQTPAGTLERAPNISDYCSSCKLMTRREIWDSVKDMSSLFVKASCRHLLAALRWLDESLGVLYDFLSERGALGNTYIVMSTDHGSGKFSLYETGTRVPLYAVGPGIRAGTVVEEPVVHIDMAPTFLSWAGDSAGASMPIQVEGLSWASLASGEASSLDREAIRTQSYFDTAIVTKNGLKEYTCKTTTIINELLSKLKDPMLIEEAESAAKNLAKYVGNAYPFLYDTNQVYNLSSDAKEQVNIWGSVVDVDLRPRDAPTALA